MLRAIEIGGADGSISERLAEISTKARTVKGHGDAIEKLAEGLKKEFDSRLAEMHGVLSAAPAAT